MKGRKPKPAHVKRLAGTARPDRARKASPPLDEPGRPQPPASLCPRGVAKFEEFVALRGDMLTEGDATALALLADCLVQYEDARSVIRELGPVYSCPTAHGVMQRQRPEVKIAADAATRAARLLVELGFTPLSRDRVPPPPLPRDPVDAEHFVF